MATTSEYLARAEQVLEDATTIASLVPRLAAREAYMAAFHAAEALILDRRGKVAKTHKGVNSTFALLARETPGLTPEIAAFLGGGYEIKQDSDYAAGPEIRDYNVTDATRAIQSARALIAAVTIVLARRP